MAKDIFIPKLGQTMEEVTLLTWQVKEGDKVEKGQAIAEVETDEAVFPIESNANGIVHLGPFQPNQVVPVLTVIAIVGTADDVFKAGATIASDTKAETAESIFPRGSINLLCDQCSSASGYPCRRCVHLTTREEIGE